MTLTGLISWIQGCAGMIAEGDGLICLENGGMTNVIVLIIIIGLIIYFIKKKKGKMKMPKNFGSFIKTR